MKTTWIAAIGMALLLVGCRRPAELGRNATLDSECGGRKVAFVYPIGQNLGFHGRAARAGCYAPLGAWTDEEDPDKGGTRKLVYELREKERETLLCCKP